MLRHVDVQGPALLQLFNIMLSPPFQHPMSVLSRQARRLKTVLLLALSPVHFVALAWPGNWEESLEFSQRDFSFHIIVPQLEEEKKA